MDPKTAQDFQSQVEGALRNYDMRMAEFSSNLREITERLTSVSVSQGIPPSFIVQPIDEPKMNPPEKYDGKPASCWTFLCQCELIFSLQDKISLIVNSLRNKALRWAQAFLAAHPITHLPFDRFIGEFCLVFDQPRKQEEATRRLLSLRQGNRSVRNHIIDFRILAVEAGWPDVALKGIFYQSLNEKIKDHLCTQPETNHFEELVSAALRSDMRLRERRAERNHSSDEPLHVGHSKLTPEERQKRSNEGLCFYCGDAGHIVSQCSKRLSCRTPSPSVRLQGNLSEDSSSPFLFVPAKISNLNLVQELSALIDSGAEHSFIDSNLLRQLKLPVESLDVPVKAAGLGGKQLSRITLRTKPILLFTSGNHREYHQFFVTDSPQTPVILGFSWLHLHNPHIDWSFIRIVNWSTYCMANCLHSALPSTPTAYPLEDPDIDLSKVPTCYHDLKAVFSKSKACALPPHRPYDCGIELLDGAPLPKGRLFNLSGPEKTAMENYIQEALSLGHIRPSSSPVGAGFFFVEKKDQSLRPCIDYRELNQITVKDKDSLPLINSVFDSVQGSNIFTKLDLRNAYHLVRVREGDEWKTAFTTPLGHYEYLVMPFGLTNAPAVTAGRPPPPPPPTDPCQRHGRCYAGKTNTPTSEEGGPSSPKKSGGKTS
uniref:CCHC-type domain-containing protein n=1 Tax=Oryzias latipes TaxID=8090 RepID=A0A3P9KE27_ORYLA